MARFEILPSLPVYGPLAEPFTATGQGSHREGFVVRFTTNRGENWVGNFQPGLSGFCEVFQHPNQREVIVVSGGQGYVVDPDDASKREYFGSSIDVAFALPERNLIAFGNGLWFEAIGLDGFLWKSERISWDGMQELRRDGANLRGEAWSPLEDRWIPFELDLLTGASNGGSYCGWIERRV